MIFVIVLVVIIFSVLVLVHEFGHFVVARRNGIVVDEFGIGFPPRLAGRRFGKTIYSINWLPLGGFVRLKGEDGSSAAGDSFAAATLWVKTKVLLAGVGMNLLLAYLILVWLAATGLPPLLAGQVNVGKATTVQAPHVIVAQVVKGSPAARAGIAVGDTIASAGATSFTDEAGLIDFTHAHAGQTVTLTVRHDTTSRRLAIHLNPAGSDQGNLGVTPFRASTVRYGWMAPVEAAALAAQLVWATLAGLGGLITGLVAHHRVSAGVTGPVGIVVILSNLIHLGIVYLLVFVASISVSLGVINALPLPALDGGRLAIATANRVAGRRLSSRAETAIHAAGFAALIALLVVITYVDIKRFL